MSKRMVIAALALVGAFIALYLALFKIGVIGQLQCSVGSCETVNTSRWSILAGMPVAGWGVAYYAVVLLLAIVGVQEKYADAPGPSRAMLALTTWGLLFSAYLTGLELFVIHAICIWCVTSACIATLLFIVALLDWRATR